MTLEPNWIVDFRWVKSGKKVLQEALVQWTGTSVEDATWERFTDLQHQFPYLNLEDKIHLQGEGNVSPRQSWNSQTTWLIQLK